MDQDRRFQFGHLPSFIVGHLETSASKDLLSKWSMKDGLKVQAFHFDRDFKVYLIDEFIQEFFGSLDVIGSLQRLAGNRFAPIGIQAESIKFQRISTTLTTTELFDRLTKSHEEEEDGTKTIVRPTGSIVKCLPDYFQPDESIHEQGNAIEVGDELRKLILRDFSDEHQFEDEDDQVFFSAEEKDEFLYRLFTHFVLGGSLCQYEDNVKPYIDMTKLLYKELMTIGHVKGNEENNLTHRNEENKEDDKVKVVIKSVVIKITSVKNENYKQEDLLFSKLHLNNFFYIIVQPDAHTLYTLYHHVL